MAQCAVQLHFSYTISTTFVLSAACRNVSGNKKVDTLFYMVLCSVDFCQANVQQEQCVVFTALHCMQRGLSNERLSVSPSVRLSVCLSLCQKRAL